MRPVGIGFIREKRCSALASKPRIRLHNRAWSPSWLPHMRVLFFSWYQWNTMEGPPPPGVGPPGRQSWEPEIRDLGASRSQSSEHFGSQRKPRIPRNYSGKDESWEDYLKHFQGVALLNRWEPDDMAECLYIALQLTMCTTKKGVR